MDANDALVELLDVSDDVRAAVVVEDGEPIASNLPDGQALEIAGVGDAMLAYAATLRQGVGVTQLQAVTADGDVYVMRRGDRAVFAIADQGSLAGLVQHDLRTLLGKSRSARRRRAVAHA